MGACEFIQRSMGSSAQDALATAVERAQYDHGHSGYSGTIAEANGGCYIAKGYEKGLPKAEAFAAANKLLDDNQTCPDKWGPCGAIPVLEEDGTIKSWVFYGLASS